MGSVDVCLVSPVKRSMMKTLRNSTVCVNELPVLLYETELVLNTRFVYDHNLEILTTNYLLFGRKLYTCSSIQGNIGIKFILPNRVHQINIIFHHNSKINTWLHYVNMEKKKKMQRLNDIKPSINDILIIFVEKQLWNKWTLGQVVEFINGHDGKTRGSRLWWVKPKLLLVDHWIKYIT